MSTSNMAFDGPGHHIKRDQREALPLDGRGDEEEARHQREPMVGGRNCTLPDDPLGVCLFFPGALRIACAGEMQVAWTESHQSWRLIGQDAPNELGAW